MIKKTTKQSTFQAILAIIGGLLFMAAAAFEALFIVVGAVMFFQEGVIGSIWLFVGPAVLMLLGWGLIALGKEKLGSALSQIAISGI